jgi:ribosomal silencing factor RsfS
MFVRLSRSCPRTRTRGHLRPFVVVPSVGLRVRVVPSSPPSHHFLAPQGGGNPSLVLRLFSSSNDNDNNNNNKNIEENTEWIPPSRPLMGDQGHHGVGPVDEAREALEVAEEALFKISDDDSEEDVLRKLEEALALEEELEQKQLQEQIEKERQYQQQRQQQKLGAGGNNDADTSGGVVDWMQTRRAALGASAEESDIIPVLEHTLLTSDEIQTLLESLGGTKVTVILDDEDQPRMGGATGMVFCTAPTSFSLQTMTRALVDHMKDRKLDEIGVHGAQLTSLPPPAHANNIHWNAIDCRKYLVHIMDESTRDDLQLEYLWSGKDPMWKLNILDDAEVDDYVAKHPVPQSYGPNPTDNVNADSWFLNPHTSRQLQKQAFTLPHRPVVPTEAKQRESTIGKRRRREEKSRDTKQNYFEKSTTK